MSETTQITPDEAQRLACSILEQAGCSPANAASTARALVCAAIDGQAGHGLGRLTTYAPQVRTGKVNGKAQPAPERLAPALIGIDAGLGFAYPAIELAIDALPDLVRENGVASAVIRRSHHFGQAGAHVERLAEKGLVGLIFGNSPAGIAFWGGNKPMMGTNPVAFAAPVQDAPPLLIDFATSVVARGKIVAAAREGETIPPDWALDGDGKPTTDPDRALEGSMMPLGGPKGAALAMMIEVLAAALTGSHFGFEASSFFEAEGPAPNVGQTIIAIDPDRFSGGAYFARMATLMAALDDQENVRTPGSERLARREKAASDGLAISVDLLADLHRLAETS